MKQHILSSLGISFVIMLTTITSLLSSTSFQPVSLLSKLGDMPWNVVSVTDTTKGLTRSPERSQKLFKDLLNYSAASSPDDVINNNTASMEYPEVCFYGNTRFFFDEKTTKPFVMNLLTFLRDISLRSYNEALIGKNKIHVLIPISSYEPHFRSWQELHDFLRPVVDTYTKLNVDFSPDAYERAASNFGNTDCKWVISAKLDADDVILPGYLDWIVQKVIPTLRRGALVGGRYMARLHIGFGRCTVDTSRGPGRHFWSGMATAQTRVFRRDVFEALGMPFESSNHSTAVNRLRRDVFEKILKLKPPKLLKNTTIKVMRNITLQKSWDAEMEKITGIRMVEPTLAREPFGPPAVYIMSPLSGHFNYSKIVKAPLCTEAVWSRFWNDAMHLNGIKSNLDYIFKTVQHVDFSVYDTCKSHTFFDLSVDFPKQDWPSTCEEMETKFGEVLAGGAT
jgi:hypothetical protein